MVLAFLNRRRASRGDDANDIVASHRIGDGQQATVHHANNDVTLLTIVLSVIKTLDGNTSLNTLQATPNPTRCLAMLALFLASSHSKSRSAI
jgi:hypothetical protein